MFKAHTIPMFVAGLLAAFGAAHAQTTSLITVYGTAYLQDGISPVPAGFTVDVRNLDEGTSQNRMPSAQEPGRYEVTFVDYSDNVAASAGDRIEVVLRTAAGEAASEYQVFLLGPQEIENREVRIDVTLRNARTWTIRADGTGEAATLPAAVDTALGMVGDTILVEPGEYTWTNQGASGAALMILESGLNLFALTADGSSVLDAEGHGSVILCDGLPDSTRIAGFTIRGGDAAGGGGILCKSSAVRLSSCVFYGNTASYGGAIACLACSPRIENCTVVENLVSDAGAGIYCSNASPLIENCVIAFNYETPGVECGDTLSSPSFGCNDLWGNEGGDGLPPRAVDLGGNISLDPIFCAAPSRDYRVRNDSPCLPENQPGPDPCGLIGALGAACWATGVDGEEGRSVSALLAAPRPNPFRENTTIWFSVPSGRAARISVYDSSGRLVKTIVDAPSPGVNGVVRWDGRNIAGARVSPGVYFVRLTTGAGVDSTRKVVFLR
ncbi:MAG: T9SS type A sorting domain-containing protein [Candidatus Eisenbacteria bacterium]